MSKSYVEKYYEQIKEHANAIEKRLDDSWCTKESVLEENAHTFEMCIRHDCKYVWIDDRYFEDIEL